MPVWPAKEIRLAVGEMETVEMWEYVGEREEWFSGLKICTWELVGIGDCLRVCCDERVFCQS